MWPLCVRQPSCRPTQCRGEAFADDWGGPATGGMAGRGPAEGPRRAAGLDRLNYAHVRRHTRQTMQLRLEHGVIVMSALPRRDPRTWSSGARPIRVGLPSVPGAGTGVVGRACYHRPRGTSRCPPRLLTPLRHRRTSSREKLSCPLRQGSRVSHRPHHPTNMYQPPRSLPVTLRTWRWRMAGHFPDGIWFLPLEEITGDEGVAVFLAQLMGQQAQASSSPVAQVRQAIGRKRGIPSCRHLIQPNARIASCSSTLEHLESLLPGPSESEPVPVNAYSVDVAQELPEFRNDDRRNGHSNPPRRLLVGTGGVAGRPYGPSPLGNRSPIPGQWSSHGRNR